MRLLIGIDLAFWGLPVCMRWQFDSSHISYVVLHVLCLEVVVEW